MQVVRAATVLVLWPLLSRLGYGLSWREGIVLVWAGLRGAVGLSLSLFVLLNEVCCKAPPFRCLELSFWCASCECFEPLSLRQPEKTSRHICMMLLSHCEGAVRTVCGSSEVYHVLVNPFQVILAILAQSNEAAD